MWFGKTSEMAIVLCGTNAGKEIYRTTAGSFISEGDAAFVFILGP